MTITRRREREETKRLLYVALTRARDRLYLGTVAQGWWIQPGRGSLAEVLPLIAPRSIRRSDGCDRVAFVFWSRPSVPRVFSRARRPTRRRKPAPTCTLPWGPAPAGSRTIDLPTISRRCRTRCRRQGLLPQRSPRLRRHTGADGGIRRRIRSHGGVRWCTGCSSVLDSTRDADQLSRARRVLRMFRLENAGQAETADGSAGMLADAAFAAYRAICGQL